MSEMGMSDILVKHLLIRDGYRGNEVKEYDAISTALGSDPTKRKQKAWKRARDKLNQEKESIRDALKEAQGQKKPLCRKHEITLPKNPMVEREKDQKVRYFIMEATFEEKKLMEREAKELEAEEEKIKIAAAKLKKAHKDIYLGAKFGRMREVREGIKNGGDPKHYIDWFKRDSLKIAEEQGFERIAELLRVETRRERKNVARQEKLDRFLFSATIEGNLHKVKMFLKAGAAPDGYCNYWESTGLHKASRAGHLDVIKALVSAGANFDQIDKSNGFSCLHYAAVNGRLRVIKYLCSLGAIVNVLDFAGRSPLHYSAELGYMECCNAFILNGCNVKQLDNCERSPADCAYRRGHMDVAEHIRLGWNLKTDRGRTHLAMKSWNKVCEAKATGKSASEILAIGRGEQKKGTSKRGKLPPRLQAAYDNAHLAFGAVDPQEEKKKDA
jgi:hypothetical protein